MRPRRGWSRSEGEAAPPRGAFVRESQVWTPSRVSPAQARPVRSAAQGGRTGCSWAGRREAEAGRNYGGEECGRGSGLRLPGSRAARPTDAGRGGSRGGALWGPRVREALKARGGRASECRGQGGCSPRVPLGQNSRCEEAHGSHTRGRCECSSSCLVSTPEKPGWRRAFWAHIVGRMHSEKDTRFFANRSFIAERPDECSNRESSVTCLSSLSSRKCIPEKASLSSRNESFLPKLSPDLHWKVHSPEKR